MAAFRDRLTAPVLIGVGAAFDFLSGRKAQAPRWIQRSGLEWLFRSLTEPNRLIARYGRIVPRFVLLVLAEMIGLIKFPLENS
jgi:N-acetylglucosaminyldiphosphoundecaprenol N-acetyl-beta-D-mannosaminyltransferase